jgi:ABC-2 type transport system permease protein
MNILWQELKFYRRSTIIWIVTLSVMVFGFLSIFRSFSADVEQAKHLLSAYPPQVLAALNLQVGIFFTIYGFFAYLLTFIWLAGSIQAMNLGISVLSKEISGKTADFLLSKPVTRVKVLTEKLTAVFTLIVLTNTFFLISAYASAKFFSPTSFDNKIFFLVGGTLFFVQLVFLAIGFFLGVVVPKIKTVAAYSLPIVFSFFIISAFGSVIGKKEVDYVTPFKYFNASYIVDHSGYEPKYLWIIFGIIIFCVIGSYLIYLRKDIQAAN